MAQRTITVRDSLRGNDERGEKRISSWKILFNSNVTPKTAQQRRLIAQRLGSTFDYLFGFGGQKGRFFDNYAEWEKESNPDYPAPTFETKRIVEVGPKYGKMHLHGSIKIVHFGKLKFDYDVIKDLGKQLICPRNGAIDCYGITNPFISVRFERVAEADVDYLEKGDLIEELDLEDVIDLRNIEIPLTRRGKK